MDTTAKLEILLTAIAVAIVAFVIYLAISDIKRTEDPKEMARKIKKLILVALIAVIVSVFLMKAGGIIISRLSEMQRLREEIYSSIE